MSRAFDDVVAGVDRFFTPKRVRVYALTFLAVMLVTYILTVAAGNPPFDVFGKPVAVDFTAHMAAGRIVLDGDAPHLYDLGYQSRAEQALLGGRAPDFLDLYLSPPFVAYLYAPFAALPYLGAAAIWTVLTVAMLLVSFHLLWSLIPNLHHHRYRSVLLVTLSIQPVIELIGDGQDSGLSLLLLCGGLRLLLAEQDVLAGAVLGLGVFKPQLFVLMPCLLLVLRRWRALASWLAVALSLAVISVAAVGRAGTLSYLHLLTSDAYSRGIADQYTWKMQSLVAMVRAVLTGPAPDLANYTALAAVAALLVVVAVSLRGAGVHRSEITVPYAATVLLMAVVNPHFFLYDCVVLILPALILLNQAPTDRTLRVMLIAAYTLAATASLRNAAFGSLPWPAPLLAAPWLVVPVLWLTLDARRLLVMPRAAPAGADGLARHGGQPRQLGHQAAAAAPTGEVEQSAHEDDREQRREAEPDRVVEGRDQRHAQPGAQITQHARALVADAVDDRSGKRAGQDHR